jgi:hypothetical protein
MTRRRAVTTGLSLLAALAWAPLGMSATTTPASASAILIAEAPRTVVLLGDTSGSPTLKVLPESSPIPGSGSPAAAPATSPTVTLPSSSPIAAMASPVAVALVNAPVVHQPVASHVAAGGTAHPSTSAMRSTRPGASSAAKPPMASAPAEAVRSARDTLPGDVPVTWTWVVAVLTVLVVLGSMLLLFGRAERADDRSLAVRAADLPGRLERRSRSVPPAGPPGGIERRRAARSPQPPSSELAPRPSRMEPADDPILRALGLDPDAPAAGGARAVRARARRRSSS